jgi:hypothetical protein
VAALLHYQHHHPAEVVKDSKMNAHVYAYLHALPHRDARIAHVIGILGLPLLERVERGIIAKRLKNWPELDKIIAECRILVDCDENALLIENYLRQRRRRAGKTPLQLVSQLLVPYRADISEDTIGTYIQRERLRVALPEESFSVSSGGSEFPEWLDGERLDQASKVLVVREISLAEKFPASSMLKTSEFACSVAVPPNWTIDDLMRDYFILRVALPAFQSIVLWAVYINGRRQRCSPCLAIMQGWQDANGRSQLCARQIES